MSLVFSVMACKFQDVFENILVCMVYYLQDVGPLRVCPGRQVMVCGLGACLLLYVMQVTTHCQNDNVRLDYPFCLQNWYICTDRG